MLRKCKIIYANDSVLLNCSSSFMIPFFVLLRPSLRVSSSLKLLDRVFQQNVAAQSLHYLAHRCSVGVWSVLYTVTNNFTHPLHCKLPQHLHASRHTRFSYLQTAGQFLLFVTTLIVLEVFNSCHH